MPQSGYAGQPFCSLLCIACEAKRTLFSQWFRCSARDSVRVAMYAAAGRLSQLYFPSLIFFQEYHLFSHQPHQLSLIESCLIQAAVLASHCSPDRAAQAFFQPPGFLLSSGQSQVSAGEQGRDPRPGFPRLVPTRQPVPSRHPVPACLRWPSFAESWGIWNGLD